ncbi:MAG: transporter substrate-binding domain-containing protein [Candidatus Heimdallarchaeota archaeon]|nr:transporter substrate-binding domain-containing protein [Candidatus Heimdallarchaeota archaeon]
MKKRYMIILPILLLSVFALVGTPATGATGTLADIESRGYLIVGSDTTYPPFEEYNSTSELAEGFDIDLAHQVAIAMGVKLKVVTSEWDPIIPNLQASQFDIIISAMTITAAREEVVDFTRWYYKSYQAILVDDANPLGIASETDLNENISIGVQAGTTSDIWLTDNLVDRDKVLTYDTILLAIAALKLGAIDVVLGDYAVLAQDEHESGETKVVGTYSPENFGFACRTDDTDLKNALDNALDGLLGTNEGSPVPTDLYNTIYYKWFGVSAGDVGYTGTVTDATIEYVWYTGASAPGFEFIFVLAIGIVPIIRKKRK